MKFISWNIHTGKLSPEMPPKCIYNLHFFKIFWGACPRTPLGPLRAFGTRVRACVTRPLRARIRARKKGHVHVCWLYLFGCFVGILWMCLRCMNGLVIGRWWSKAAFSMFKSTLAIQGLKTIKFCFQTNCAFKWLIPRQMKILCYWACTRCINQYLAFGK